MTKQQAIEFLEFAPATGVPTAVGLAYVKIEDGILCPTCVGRLIGRGCGPGGETVWLPVTTAMLRCSACNQPIAAGPANRS